MAKQISHSFLRFNIIYGLSREHDFMFSAAKIEKKRETQASTGEKYVYAIDCADIYLN